MNTKLVFVNDEDLEPIEQFFMPNNNVYEVLQMVDKINEFKLGEQNYRYLKTNWVCVDFSNGEIEVAVKFE